MTIDTSGKWWKGSDPHDIEEYLQALSSGSYSINEFRLARCKCGSERFLLESDSDESVARRTCSECGKVHFVCDSGEFWEDADPQKYTCVTCKSKEANIGVGFALYDDKTAVHWVYVGCRCAKCGVLGCMADWKIGYKPSFQLLNEA